MLLLSSGTDHDTLRTPTNETISAVFDTRKTITGAPNNLLDIDDDSLAILSSTRTADTVCTTTTDSEALTIVTSTGDSMTAPHQAASANVAGLTTAPPGSGSGSDLTVATTTAATESAAPADADTASTMNRSSILRSLSLRSSSTPDLLPAAPADGTGRRGDGSYEDYVRKLQLKISQISNARDSIDIRKTKRRHSKGDQKLATTDQASDAISAELHGPNVSPVNQANVDAKRTLSIFVHPTGLNDEHTPSSVGERIEEITKERTKQKDLIHDLVMDKLQSKKQLNAEKRLNRSRNRNSMIGNAGAASSSSRISTGVLTLTPSSNHSPSVAADRHSIVGHSSFASLAIDSDRTPPDMRLMKDESATTKYDASSPGKRAPSVGSVVGILPGTAAPNTKRPVGEYYACDASAREPAPAPSNRLTNTKSCCMFPTESFVSPFTTPAKLAENVIGAAAAIQTPVPPPRRNRADSVPSSATSAHLAEQLRLDARRRARLRSNHDLEISPEEKLQLMGFCRQPESGHVATGISLGVEVTAVSAVGTGTPLQLVRPSNKSDDMKVRDRKMMASKSVNDIASVLAASSTAPLGVAAAADAAASHRLHLWPVASGANECERSASTVLNRRTNQRAKDPERRKSIISYVSDLFHKKKTDSGAAGAVTVSGGVGSGGSGGSKTAPDGMFGRFRISPKSKSKVRKN